MKKFLVILSLFMIFISQCIFEVSASSSSTEQYAYPISFTVGSGGKANVSVICETDKTNEKILFDSWGNYSVSLNQGYSITLNSRSYQNADNKIKITCKFTTFNFNSHESQTYTLTKTITYKDVSSYHNFG